MLRRITGDHSLVAEMVEAGEITEEQAALDPRRSMITRALGIEPDVEVDVYPVELRTRRPPPAVLRRTHHDGARGPASSRILAARSTRPRGRGRARSTRPTRTAAKTTSPRSSSTSSRPEAAGTSPRWSTPRPPGRWPATRTVSIADAPTDPYGTPVIDPAVDPAATRTGDRGTRAGRSATDPAPDPTTGRRGLHLPPEMEPASAEEHPDVLRAELHADRRSRRRAQRGVVWRITRWALPSC